MADAPLRLEQIPTQWSLIRRAHGATPTGADEARRILVLRYSAAVRRYVGAIVRDDEDADELAQDTMVRLLKGDFGGADPNRGRFRDLLKTAIRNLARTHLAKKARRRPIEFDLGEVADDDSDDSTWVGAWQANILDIAWAELEAYENSHPGSVAYTVLRLRADRPDAPMEELAEALGAKIGRTVQATAFRQQLRRARMRFAESLIREVADGLEDASPNRVCDELIALCLYEQVREFLPAEWGQST